MKEYGNNLYFQSFSRLNSANMDVKLCIHSKVASASAATTSWQRSLELLEHCKDCHLQRLVVVMRFLSPTNARKIGKHKRGQWTIYRCIIVYPVYILDTTFCLIYHIVDYTKQNKKI